MLQLKKSDNNDSKRDEAERKKLKDLSEIELDSDGFAYRVRNTFTEFTSSYSTSFLFFSFLFFLFFFSTP